MEMISSLQPGRSGARTLASVCFFLFLITTLNVRAADTVFLDRDDKQVRSSQQLLKITGQDSPFGKEPDFGGRGVYRGTLRIDAVGNRTNTYNFIWDAGIGNLYLDLNRNGDLTDDRVYASTNTQNHTQQSFKDVRIGVITEGQVRFLIADVTLFRMGYGSDVGGILSWTDLWTGKLRSKGRDWQVAVFKDPSGLEQGCSLFLRNWDQSNRLFSRRNARVEGVDFTGDLFIDETAYRLVYRDEPGANSRYALEPLPVQPQLSPVLVNGKFIDRLVLTKTHSKPLLTVLMNSPEPTVQIPVGQYTGMVVYLKSNGAQAISESGRQFAMTVPTNPPVVLNIGGPLTNSVVVRRTGDDVLLLDYRAVGAGGLSFVYLSPGSGLQQKASSPRFVVYQGEKQVGSGTFEYG